MYGIMKFVEAFIISILIPSTPEDLLIANVFMLSSISCRDIVLFNKFSSGVVYSFNSTLCDVCIKLSASYMIFLFIQVSGIHKVLKCSNH